MWLTFIDDVVRLLSLLPGLFLGGLDSILVLSPLIGPLTSVTGFKALSGWCLGVTGGHGDLKLPALNASICFRLQRL